jgi:transcriptional regulator with XRE-family HTH domain
LHHSGITSRHSLSADLRALRKARGVTLADLAQRLGRSVGWLSQVERDLSQPSVTDLREIAAALDVPLSLLLAESGAPAREAGYIVRGDARRPIGKGKPGLTEELLSPDLTDDFEMVHSTFAPHSRAPDIITRPTQEVGYILSGRLDLTIAGTDFTVGGGDSFRIRGEPFIWRNPYDSPAAAIWVIAPPVY